MRRLYRDVAGSPSLTLAESKRAYAGLCVRLRPSLGVPRGSLMRLRPNGFAPVHLGGAVEVGEMAFLGVGAVVLPGLKIGEGAVVGAGAVVTKDVPAWTMVVGVPARVVREVES